jgi:hypothetical protein
MSLAILIATLFVIIIVLLFELIRTRSQLYTVGHNQYQLYRCYLDMATQLGVVIRKNPYVENEK